MAPLLGLGSFWYLRNLFLAGSPLPAVKLPVLPSPELPSQHSDFAVAHYLGDGGIWRHFFLPGLHGAFGVLWPAVLAAAALGAALAIWKGRTPLVRVLGVAVLVAAVAYVLTPYGAQGTKGHPSNFESNLRYAGPALFIGMALLASAPELAAPRRRLAALAVLVALFVVADTPLDARHGPYLKAALAIAVLIVLAAFAVGRLSPRGLGTPVLAACLAVLGALVVVIGHRQERLYIEGRYASPSGVAANARLDLAFTWARGVHGARIATDAFRQYGLYGTDLTNRVEFLGIEGAHGSFLPILDCPTWRRALNAGGYQYVVPAPTFRNGAQKVLGSPALEWTRSDPAARLVPGAGSVFRVMGRFDPATCPPQGD